MSDTPRTDFEIQWHEVARSDANAKFSGMTMFARQLERENAELRRKYNELIMHVGNKYPGESRHETVLRYITQAETTKDNRAQQTAAIDAARRDA